MITVKELTTAFREHVKTSLGLSQPRAPEPCEPASAALSGHAPCCGAPCVPPRRAHTAACYATQARAIRAAMLHINAGPDSGAGSQKLQVLAELAAAIERGTETLSGGFYDRIDEDKNWWRRPLR